MDTKTQMAHAADPQTLLALARDVFGHVPEAWWLTIPAVNLEFGESLSPLTKAGSQQALNELNSLAAHFCLAGEDFPPSADAVLGTRWPQKSQVALS